jgi:hypothetical protein
MRPQAPWLPSARSRKWHSRRWWDELGYFRVRTLANPNWPAIGLEVVIPRTFHRIDRRHARLDLLTSPAPAEDA